MSNDRNNAAPHPGTPTNPSPKEAASLGTSTAGVTRRDFVGTTLLGAGAALLTSFAPGAIKHAAAQTTGLPLNGLSPAWSGPGGVGDYASANGNTHEVVNAAHTAIRNHDFEKYLASATDTGETFDLLIVGAGIAGLSTAYTYHQERKNSTVLALDQHAIFGGEAKQNEFDVDGTHLWAPQGSTGMVFPLATAKKFGFYSGFYDKLDFPKEWTMQEPQGLTSGMKIPQDIWSPMHLGWEKADIGYYFEGKGFVKNCWRNGWKDAPIPDKLKMDLMVMGMQRNAPERADWQQYLDSMTYLDYLTKVMGVGPEVTNYLNPIMAAMGTGLGADAISALSAYNFMMPGVINYNRDIKEGKGDGQTEIQLVSLPGGNASIARRLVQMTIPGVFEGSEMSKLLLQPINWKALDRPNQPVRIRLKSTVLSVKHNGSSDSAKSVTVVYLNDGKLYKVRGKAVAVCGQQHVNKHICQDIPSDYREAMGHFHHAPILTVNVAVRNWKFMDKLGISCARWFEGFGWWTGLRRNVVLDGKETMPLNPNKPTVLTSYNPFLLPGVPHAQQCTAARMQLYSTPFAAIESGVRDQYQKMFGSAGFDAKRDIAGIVANRWGHAYVVDQPGFFYGKNGKPAPKDVIRKPFNRMAFAHAELTGTQMWETAAEEGERAAHQLLEAK